MSVQTQLFQRLRDADQLPSAPGVALRIVELNQQEDVEIAELAEVISRDPALAAKVIKTANSSMFGVPREVTNIKRAVLVLGLRTVNLLALSFSVIASSSGSAVVGFDHRRFWTQTATTAMGSRLLALRVAPDLKDDAFLAGLLASFGQLVLAERAPDLYKPVVERVGRGEPVLDVERELLGCTHADLGSSLLDSWGLPESVCEAIRLHRSAELLNPPAEDASAHCRLARVLAFGATCGDLLTGGDLEQGTAGISALGARSFGLDGAACGEILAGIQEAAQSLGRSLGLDLEQDSALAAIRHQATELLLRETLALHQQVKSVSHEMVNLERRARTDALTGLRNRGAFDEELAEDLGRVQRGGRHLGLLMIDVDHFKSVNDECGHVVGDAILREVARALQSALDAGDAAYRYGGEEFALLCHVGDVENLREKAEAVRGAIAQAEVVHDRGALSRTASVGGCFVPLGSKRSDVRCVVEQADRQLYLAKQAGRDRTCVETFRG